MNRPGAARVLCLLVALTTSLATAHETSDPPPERVRVAVLDFENRSTLDASAVSYLTDVPRGPATFAAMAFSEAALSRGMVPPRK